jgi:septum formation inhibitor MinC
MSIVCADWEWLTKTPGSCLTSSLIQPQNRDFTDLQKIKSKSINSCAGHWWLTPVILAIQEAEIRKIEVQSQHRANSL